MIGMALRLGIGFGLIGLVLWAGGGIQILSTAYAKTGWVTILAAAVCHTVPASVCGLAWWTTAGRPKHPSLPAFLIVRWIRDGIGQLLPLIPLGGEVASARLLSQMGLGGVTAAAVTVADITAETLTQAIYSLLGALCWVWSQGSQALWGYAGFSLALTVPIMIALVAAQRLGLIKLLESLADRVMPDAWKTQGMSAPIHHAIARLYANRQRFMTSSAIHLTAWIVAIAEAWVVLKLMGHPITLIQTCALESAIYAVRSAAFLVPAALGVQEGAYVLIGGALGLPSEVALALALVKRGRELALGLPAIAVWLLIRKSVGNGAKAGQGTDMAT